MAALELLIYPQLWSRSLAEHPIDWRGQFRALCRLSQAWLAAPSVPVGLLGRGEHKLLDSLASCDIEMMLLQMAIEFHTESNPMWRLDPAHPGIDALRASRAAAAKERPP
jgi:hypothetical protein